MRSQFKQFNASVLVVEDYPINQELTKELLTLFGCEVDVAENGLQALAILESKKFDVIFMDIQMPEMDGYQVAKTIRKKEGDQRHTLIIALTANALQGDSQKCIDAGMDDYLSKPIRGADLEAILSKFLSNKIRE